MAIDTATEDLISFQQARNEFPGRRVSLAGLHRWRLDGVRGAKLETCLIGGQRFTSKQAIQRFIVAQNRDTSSIPALSSGQRQRQSAAAREVLAREFGM